MKCPKCKSENISKRGKRYNKSGEKQLYLCNKCGRKFVEQDGFERMRHNKRDIVRAIHLHNEGLSFFQVKDHLWQHDGVRVSREAIRKWCNKHSVFLNKVNELVHPTIEGNIHYDEKYVKVNGKNCYDLNAIDSKTKFVLAHSFIEKKTKKECVKFLKQIKDRCFDQILYIYKQERYKKSEERNLVEFTCR